MRLLYSSVPNPVHDPGEIARLARRGSGCFRFRAGNVGLVIGMVGELTGEQREQNEGKLEQVELGFRGCE